MRLRTIEWEFGKSVHTGKDVVVRLKFILNNGMQSSVFGFSSDE